MCGFWPEYRRGGTTFWYAQVVRIADLGSHHDAAGRLDGAFRRSILAEREVRPRPLIVRNVGPKDPTKMPVATRKPVARQFAHSAPWYVAWA